MTKTEKIRKLNEFISQINDLSPNYKLGELQALRKEHKSKQRLPSKTPFRATNEDYVFHHGGSEELQFNMGDDNGSFRWGIAISLQTSEWVHDLTEPLRKLKKLSGILEQNFDHLRRRGFLLWHSTGPKENRLRSDDRLPQRIECDLYKKGTFIFLGKYVPFDEFDPRVVLQDFDFLFPVYECVELDLPLPRITTLYIPKTDFSFVPDPKGEISINSLSTRINKSVEKTANNLHREIQNALKLILERDGFRVGIEHADGRGGLIDVVASRHEGEYLFYEIKTNPDPRLCVREAIGQLLEYAFRPIPIHPKRLTIVTATPLDAETDEYLRILKTELGLNIYHLYIDVDREEI